MSTVTVETGARLHLGFINLSSDRDRLFGSLGVGLKTPTLRLTARPDSSVTCANPVIEPYAETAVSLLDVPGVAITVESMIPRHVGFGSGTQSALATIAAIAAVYEQLIDVREVAPALGRGRRSGIGVATFEHGGFIVDGGQPDWRSVQNEDDWQVPPVIAQHQMPADWRFITILPTAANRIQGEQEEHNIDRVINAANAAISDRIAALVTQTVLPGLVTGNIEQFGRGITRIDQLNGKWFRPAQSDPYHPAVGGAIKELRDDPAIAGVGQSSWGPMVYGLTHVDHAENARRAAQRALDGLSMDGMIQLLTPRSQGAAIIAGKDQKQNIKPLDGGVSDE